MGPLGSVVLMAALREHMAARGGRTGAAGHIVRANRAGAGQVGLYCRRARTLPRCYYRQ